MNIITARLLKQAASAKTGTVISYADVEAWIKSNKPFLLNEDAFSMPSTAEGLGIEGFFGYVGGNSDTLRMYVVDLYQFTDKQSAGDFKTVIAAVEVDDDCSPIGSIMFTCVDKNAHAVVANSSFNLGGVVIKRLGATTWGDALDEAQDAVAQKTALVAKR